MRLLGALLALPTLALPTPALSAPGAADQAPTPYVVTGDAIDRPLAGEAGDAARGESILLDRRRGLCLLCHSGPFPGAHEQGTIGPDLAGVGARLSEAQLRLRVVDMRRLDPGSIMPAYYRVAGLERVGEPWRGKPVLTAREIEDVVAYLATLKE